MKKKLFILGLMASAINLMAQTQKNESWYFKMGGSYFTNVVATEFPTVAGQPALESIYSGGKLISQEAITGSFGKGMRSGISVGYRVNNHLGFEMGMNYYQSTAKTMVNTVDKVVAPGPTYLNLKAEGQIIAYDLAPAIVLYLGEVKGFEPYSKIGVIVPVYGKLDIKTDIITKNALGQSTTHRKDQINPSPTAGFMAALGTNYKLSNKISAYAELEYRNFTVHGKNKETKEYIVNGVDKLNTLPTSEIHSNYVEQLNTNSNNGAFTTVDTTKPKDELTSFVGISGIGLSVGVKYSL